MVGEPGWARLDRKEEEGSGDSDDEFFRETQEVVDRSPAGVLQPGRLALRKLKDVNYSTHKEGAVIRSTEFHPTSTVGMVAGNNGTVSLFQVHNMPTVIGFHCNAIRLTGRRIPNFKL